MSIYLCSIYLRGLAPCFCKRGGTRRRRRCRRRGGGPGRSHAQDSGACDRPGPVSIGRTGGAQRVPPNWSTSRHQPARRRRCQGAQAVFGSSSSAAARRPAVTGTDQPASATATAVISAPTGASWIKALHQCRTVPARCGIGAEHQGASPEAVETTCRPPAQGGLMTRMTSPDARKARPRAAEQRARAARTPWVPMRPDPLLPK